MNRTFIGIDIGGTNTRLALVDETGRILSRRRMASSISQGRARFVDVLLAEIGGLCREAEVNGMTVVGAGAGIPGLIGRDGFVASSVNMQALEGCNLAELLKERAGMPVVCANDANVIALGEWAWGAGRAHATFLMITIGTGLGSGLILDGRLWSGAGGYAAEFGHVTVHPDGRECPCGNRGCLEQYVSAAALVRHAEELYERNHTALPAGVDAEKLALLARSGDRIAREAFETAGQWLGIALASLANTLNPEAVVIGGGVAGSIDLMLPVIRQTINDRAFSYIADALVILQAELGDDAGLLGGAALAAESAGTVISRV